MGVVDAKLLAFERTSFHHSNPTRRGTKRRGIGSPTIEMIHGPKVHRVTYRYKHSGLLIIVRCFGEVDHSDVSPPPPRHSRHVRLIGLQCFVGSESH